MFKLQYQSSRIFNTLTIIILSLLCLLLNQLTKINFYKLDLPQNKPEFFATGVEAKLYSPSGKLLYQFNAESGNQFPNTNQINMNNLKFQVFPSPKNANLIMFTSQDGWVNNQTNLGFLGKSVVIIQESSIESHIIRIYTQNVNINATLKEASSSAKVLAVQGKSHMEGVGFILNYESQTLILESQVVVDYVK